MRDDSEDETTPALANAATEKLLRAPGGVRTERGILTTSTPSEKLFVIASILFVALPSYAGGLVAVGVVGSASCFASVGPDCRAEARLVRLSRFFVVGVSAGEVFRMTSSPGSTIARTELSS
ncbi:MAG TPA: hypothetical protein VM580_04865 [Labilithrix sp.]|jgi:hypothetical protein|nr:hypothetical protein [Labilithrix sp.]